MKKTMMIIIAAVSLLTACGDKKKTTPGDNSGVGEETGLTVNDSDGKTGSFSVDGTSFKGKSSTQYFGDKATGQFSVLCQQDEPFALLQAVFNNESNASGEMKPSGSSYKVAAGEANVALSGTAIGEKEFVTKSDSKGSITVSGKKMILKDLELFSQDNNKKVVSAEVEF